MRQAEAIFDDARAVPADERDAFLERACEDDQLREDVRRLLRADEGAGSFFDGVGERVAAAIDEALDGEPIRQRIGPYRIVERIGAGGMGAVYLAERADGEFEQRVAIKLIRHGMESEQAVERFLAERQILARLGHPCIARLIDGGLTPQRRPYLVMEYVDGIPIDRYCEKHSLPLSERIELLERVAEAVAFAHRNLIVHRDLKPTNILVTAEREVKLLDFGIAKPLGEPDATGLTRTGARVMTPDYAAPEQITSSAITTATDVYGLGLVLYELLCGRRPFSVEGKSSADLENAIVHDDPPKPSSVAENAKLRGDLDTICMKALRKEPERRYASVRELAFDLRCYREGLPVLARGDTLGYRAGKFIRRQRLAVAVASIVLAIVFGFGASLAQQYRQTAAERDKAKQISELLIQLLTVADPNVHRGRDLSARDVLDRGAAQIDTLEGQPDVQATLMDVMGRAYRNLGDYDRAEGLLVRALVIRRATLPEDAPEIAHSMRNLGEVHRLRGDYEQAEPLLRDALKLESEPETQAALARVLIARGKFEEAESLLREALAADDEKAAEVFSELGALYLQQSRLDESRDAFESALATRRRMFGPDHPSVPAALSNLATVLSRAGDHSEAEKANREALELYEGVYGGKHPAVATTLSNLGANRYEQGDAAQAEDLYRRALAMRRELLGPSHPEIAQTANNLALLLQNEGRLDESEPLLHEALEMRTSLLGERHPLVAMSLNNLGLLQQARGDLDAAEGSLQRGLTILKATLGDKHPSVASNLTNLGGVALARDDPESARDRFEASLAIRREALPPGHAHLAYSLLGLGRALCALDRRGEAVPMLDEALKIRSNAGGDTKEVRKAKKDC